MTSDSSQKQTETNSVSILLIVLALRSSLFLGEFFVGWQLHSFSLLAVAGHLFVDILSILIALFASSLAQNRADQKETIEAWGALLNGVLLLGIALFISVNVFINGEELLTTEASLPLLGIAILGLVIKLINASLLSEPSHHNLNLRGVFFHAIADAFNSVSLIVAFFIIFFFGWVWVDQITSLALSLIMFITGFLLLRKSIPQV